MPIAPPTRPPAQSQTLAPNRFVPDLAKLPDVLADHVRRHYTPTRMRRSDAPLAEIHADALRDLSGMFTQDREVLPPGYLTQPRYRGAYLLYFVPTGVATVQTVLAGARVLDPPPPPGTTLRVLDVGAGPLTASLAVALRLPPGVKLSVTAIDAALPILEDGRDLLRALVPEAEVTLIAGNLRDGRTLQRAEGRFDLILVANVLNEWAIGGKKAQAPTEFVEKLLATRLAEHGTAVLIEPGTRTGSHALVEVREHLLATTELAILGPCMGRMPCPLADARDWCHAEQPWVRPPLVAQLDEAIGHRRSTLKYSHLVLADRPQPAAQPYRFRVIGGPMRADGMFRRYLCGTQGRLVAAVSETEMPRHPALRDAWRGDALEVPGAIHEEKRGRHQETILVPRGAQPTSGARVDSRPRPDPGARPRTDPRPSRTSPRRGSRPEPREPR